MASLARLQAIAPEQDLRNFFESAPLMMGVVALTGQGILHLYGNAAAARFQSTSIESLINRPAEELLVSPDELRVWRFHYLESEKSHGPVTFSYWHSIHQELRHVTVTVFPVSEELRHFGYISQDTTEVRRTETSLKSTREGLRRSESIMKQAEQMANFGAWALEISNREDLNANPLTWSDQTYRIFGYEPGSVQVTNELFFERVHADDRKLVQEAVARAFAEHRFYSFEHRIIRPDGTERRVIEHGDITYDAQGLPIRIVGAVQDITERKQLEDRLRKAIRSRDDFLSIASHELRTPLTSLKLQYQGLERLFQREFRATPLKVDLPQVLNRCIRQIDRLTRLVDDMLDISRIATGRLTIRRERDNLSETTYEIIDRMKGQLTAPGIHLKLDIQPEITGFFDRFRIEQVIMNLLTNALNYGSPDPPQETTIELSLQRTGTTAELQIKDYGAGIDIKDQKRIFNRFERASPEGGISGFGLGLYISRHIVVLHGGKIWVESSRGRGATFIVRIPLAELVTVK